MGSKISLTGALNSLGDICDHLDKDRELTIEQGSYWHDALHKIRFYCEAARATMSGRSGPPATTPNTHTSVTIRRQDGVELELTLDHDSGRVVLKKKDGTEETLYATYLEPLATSEPKGAETR